MIGSEPGITQRMAQRYAELIRDEPAVRRLWVQSRPGQILPGQELVEFWILTDEIDDDALGRLADAVQRLNDEVNYDEATATLNVLTQSGFEFYHLPAEFPENTIEVPLRNSSAAS